MFGKGLEGNQGNFERPAVAAETTLMDLLNERGCGITVTESRNDLIWTFKIGRLDNQQDSVQQIELLPQEVQHLIAETLARLDQKNPNINWTEVISADLETGVVTIARLE